MVGNSQDRTTSRNVALWPLACLPVCPFYNCTPRRRTMSDNEALILQPSDIELIDRGAGVRTTPLVGKWNRDGNQLTTGMTAFEPGKGIAMHSHNVEETVMILEGQ